MSYIIDKLFLGDWQDANNTNFLQTKLGITHILTVEGKPISLEARQPFEYKHIYALDVDTEDLLSHFDESNQFIGEGRASGGVFVHCHAGVSRSATLVLAHLMNKMQLTLDDALKLATKQRPFINPNGGFVQQLQLYESMGSRVDPNDKKFKVYKLDHLASEVMKALSGITHVPGKKSVVRKSTQLRGINSAEMLLIENSLTSDPSSSSQGSEVFYKCKKCRRSLFRQSGLMPHDEGCGADVFSRPWESHSRELSVSCTKSLFVEPVEWMKRQIMDQEGKLNCPKCSAKLGSFNWAGEQCSCGTWVTPAFHIAVAKVDECVPRVLPSGGQIYKHAVIGAQSATGDTDGKEHTQL